MAVAIPGSRTGGTPAPGGERPKMPKEPRYWNAGSKRMETAKQMQEFRQRGQPRQAAQGRGGAPGAARPRPESAAEKREKAPYEPWSSPYRTNREFREGYEGIAKQTYGPKLAALNEQQSEAKNLYKIREGEAGRIYQNYSEKAQQALQEARGAMADIASRTGAQTAGAQNLFNAAITNAQPGFMPGVQSPEAQRFLTSAAEEAGFTGQSLAQKQTSALNELAQNAAQVPLAGRTQETIAENQTLQDALSKIASERGKVTEEIPNDIAKARAELTKEEVGRAATRLQRELTQEKIGVEAKAKSEADATNKAKIKAGEQASREKASATVQAARERRAAAEASARYKREHEGEILSAKAHQAAVKWFGGYIKRQPHEFPPGLNQAQKTELMSKGDSEYRRNAMSAYETLTTQYGQNALEAFSILRSAGGYFKTFADEHERIYKQATEEREGKRPLSNPKTITGSSGGLGSLPKGGSLRTTLAR